VEQADIRTVEGRQFFRRDEESIGLVMAEQILGTGTGSSPRAPMPVVVISDRGQQFGLIVDEYGDLKGVVSLTDVLTSIVGELPEHDSTTDDDVVRREDGSLLVDGSIGLERLKAVLEIDELPAEEERSFHTVGGFAMHCLGRIPSVADHFDTQGYRFEVVDMDRNRVDKVLISKLPEQQAATHSRD
jgi:putative hemolysin